VATGELQTGFDCWKEAVLLFALKNYARSMRSVIRCYKKSIGVLFNAASFFFSEGAGGSFWPLLINFSPKTSTNREGG
jgi:hypothetical protein